MPAISKYMSTPVCTITPDETLVSARRLMSDRCVRHLPVLVEDGRVVGIITERDLFIMSAFHHLDAAIASVRTAMTPGPVCFREDVSQAEAAAELDRRQISCAPVTDEHGRLVGIFTEADAMRALATELAAAKKA